MKLKVQNLTKVYNHPVEDELNFTVLSDISFTLDQDNRLLVVMGESGVGKTTLIELILGRIRPTAGKITFNDLVINTMKGSRKSRFLRQVGYVNQFPQDTIDFRLSPRENLLLFGSEVSEAVLEKLDLLKIMDNSIMSFSGGELRRFMVAREIGRTPSLLICDEPTAHLDQRNREIVWNMIQEYTSSADCVTIVSTHDPELKHKNTMVLEKKGWKT